MFFLSLLVMLFFSTGILTYTGLFQSREAAYLLTTPASADRVFAYKFVEAIGFSSWGFLLLGSPMMVAYGITVGASAAFYLVFVLYLLSFVLLAGEPGGGRGDPRGELLPEAAEDGPGARAWRPCWRRRWWSASGWRGRPASALDRLARRPAPEARMEPEPALAEPLDVRRADRRGQGRLAHRRCSTSAS